MNVMTSFTLKSLKRNKKRTIVTIIGVIISTAMIVAVATLGMSFIDLFQRVQIADNGNWHALLHAIETKNIETVRNNDSVDAAFFCRQAGFSRINSSIESKPYLNIREYTAGGFEQMSVRLTQGRLPQKPGEVILSASIIQTADHPFAVGDSIELLIGQRFDSENQQITYNAPLKYTFDEETHERSVSETFVPEQTRTFEVVGIMERPTFEQSWSAGLGVLGFIDETVLTDNDKVDAYITMKNLDRSLYTLVPALANSVNADGASYHNDLLRYYGVMFDDNLFAFVLVFTAFIIAVIMIASVSLIYNAFAISVAERSKQLGLLASTGATKAQKRKSVYAEGFFIGLVGIPIGIISGIGGIAITIAAIQPLINSFTNLPKDVTLMPFVSVFAIVAAILLSAVTIFISVYKPARRASKIAPIDAIRQTRDIRLTRKRIRTSKLTRRLFGIEGEIALKNLKRSRKKYRATIVSLVISLVLFLTVSSYTQTMGSLSDMTIVGYNYDIQIHYRRDAGTHYQIINERIAKLDLVTNLTETIEHTGFTKFKEDQISEYTKLFCHPDEDGLYGYYVRLIALDPDSFSEYAAKIGVDVKDYSDKDQPKAILINYAQDYHTTDEDEVIRVAGDIFNIQTNDTLLFYLDTDMRSTETRPLVIGAVTDERPIGTNIQLFYSPTIVLSHEAFFGFIESLGKIAQSDLYYFTYIQAADEQQLEKQLSSMISDHLVYSIYNVHSASRQEQNIQTFLGVFVYGFIVLISLICIANIFNTVSTNIALRRREFAMLRSVGLTPKGFSKLIRFESVFYGLKGLLYGLPISVVIAYLLHTLQLSVLRASFSLPWKSYGFAVLIILFIVFSTMLYATAKIKKENIIDALRDENA